MPNRPTYTLYPSYPIRRVLWRPGYECELAVVAHVDFSVSSQHIDHLYPSSSTRGRGPSSGLQSRVESSICLDTTVRSLSDHKVTQRESKSSSMSLSEQQHSDAVELWDVRRSWLPKWSVSGTSVEGGVTGTQYSAMVPHRILNYYHVDIEFADPYTLLAQNTNGTFTQLDMRDVTKPLDTISRALITWTPNSTLAFVIDNAPRSEIPYDDMYVQSLAITYTAHASSFLFCFLFTYRISSHPTKLNHEIMALVEPSVIKHIGDRSFQPKTQKLGWFRSPEIQSGVDTFVTLAASYMIDGDDASSSCVKNMEVRFVQAFLFPISDHTNQAALAAGKPHIAQIWLLMSTLLSEATNLPQPTTRSLSATPPDSPSKRTPHVASLGNITTAVVQQQNQIQLRKQTHCPGAQTQHEPSTPQPTAAPTPIPAQSSIPHTLPSWRNTSTPASTSASADTSRSPDFSRVPRPGSSYHFPSLLHSASSRLRAPTAAGHRSPSVSKKPTPASSNASSPLHSATTLPPAVSNAILHTSAPTPRRTSGLTLSLRRESIDSGATDSSVMTIPSTSVAARNPVSSSTQRSFSVNASRRQYQQQEFHGRMSPGDKNLSVAASTKHVGEGVLSDSDSDEEKEGQEESDPDGDDREEGGNEEMDHNNGVGVRKLLPSTNNDEMIVSSAADFAVPGSLFSQASQKKRNRRDRLWTMATKAIDGEAYHDHLSNSPSSGSTDSEEDGEEDEEDGTTQKSFATISLANQRTSFERGVDLRQRSRSSTLASLSAGPAAAQVQVPGQGRVPMLSLKHGNQKNIATVEANSNGGSRIIEQSPVPDTRVGRDSQPRALTTSTSRHRTGTKQQKPHGHDIYSRSHTEVMKAKAERMTKRRIEIVRAQEERIENYVWEAVKKAFEELLVIVSFPRCVY